MQKDYKAILRDKRTGQKMIYYARANTLAQFKGICKGSYPHCSVVEAKVNKESLMYFYCNVCKKEVHNIKRGDHRH